MNNNNRATLSPLAFAISIALFSNAYADEAATTQTPDAASDQAQPADDAAAHSFERIVVIGNSRKRIIEASVPFSQITEEALLLQAPRNIADALINIPSLQIENTSGNTNNEYRFRGVGAGGTQFLEFEEDGIPIMRDAPDFLYRVHNGIGGIDAVRGGNSPILRTAAIGAVINFKYREAPMDEFAADVLVQTSDFGMKRIETWVGGPINDQLGFTFSGYYTEDDGVREVNFDANKGHNLHTSLKYYFDDDSGFFKVSARKFRENNVVYLGVPLKGDAFNPQTFPGGPDITTGSLLSDEIAYARSYSAPGQVRDIDTRDGNLSDMHYIGTELSKAWDVSDDTVMTLISRNRYTRVDAKFAGYYAAGFALNGDFQTGESLVTNLLNTNTVGAGLVNYAYAMPAGFSPTHYMVRNQQGTVLDNGALYDANGNGVIDAGEASSTASSLANGNGIFMPIASFAQSNPFDSFQQDIELNFQIDTDEAQHYLALGYYHLSIERSQDNHQQLFLTDLKPQASRVDVLLQNAQGDTVSLTDEGFLSHNHWLNREFIHDRINAYYATYEIKMDALTMDLGVRYDMFSNRIVRENTQNVYGDDAGQTPLPDAGSGVSPAQSAMQQFDGTFRVDQDFTNKEMNYTAGANYMFSDTLAVYGRLTKGSLPNPNGATDTRVYELGARFDGGDFIVAANLFSMTQDGDIQERQLTIDGEQVTAQFKTDRESIGLEVESSWKVTDALTMTFSGTLQKPEFASGGSATLRPGSTITQAQLDAELGDLTRVDGKQIANQPESLGTLTFSYDVPYASVGTFTLSSTLRYVGEVPLDDANTNFVGDYTQINAGINFESEAGDWYARLNIQNLTDEEAIQRVFGGPQSITDQQVAADGFYGRPLLGRNITFAVGYRF